MMPKLNLPSYSFRMRNEGEKTFVFDALRRKYVRLTPEEWVRQHFVRFLQEKKGVPASLMAVEPGVKVNGNPLRADLLVFNRRGEPLLVAEFKAPSVELTQQAFDQVARYNMQLKVEYLIVSNGVHHYCCRMNYALASYSFIPDIPSFREMLG